MNKIFFTLMLAVMSKTATAGAMAGSVMNIASECRGDSTCKVLKIGGLFIMIAIIFALYKAIGIVYDWLFKKRIEKKKRFNDVANVGYLAFQNNLAESENPHPLGSEDYDFWNRGYKMAARRRGKT